MYSSKLILKIIIKIQGKGGIPKTGTVKIRGKFFSEIQGEINFTNIFASYLIQVPFWYKQAFLYKLKLLTAKIAFPSPSSRASSIKAILSVKDLYSSKE